MSSSQTIDQAYACLDQGDAAQALRLLQAALVAAPGDADLHFALGNVHRESGNEAAAVPAYRAALAAQPAHAKAHNNLGVILLGQGARAQAQEHFEKALSGGTQLPDAAFNLGTLLQEQERIAEAAPWLARACAWRPDFAPAQLRLGLALSDLGRLEEGVAALHAAIAIDPGHAGAHNDLGLLLAGMNRLDEAVQVHHQAVALAPDNDEFRTNLAFALMQSGDFAPAWEMYEHRWRAGGSLRPAYRYDPAQEWHGGPLTGRRLRVWWEQGLGDTLWFARYLPVVAQRYTPAALSLECQRGMGRLLRHSLPGIEVIEEGETGSAFDLHVPLLSLPQRCGIGRGTQLTVVPYLAPTPEAVEQWQARVAALPGLRVGVAWASGIWGGVGSALRLRSVDAGTFEALFEVPGCSFTSLQKGARADDARRWGALPAFTDWTDAIADFNDTAALIASLDLVISVDTSVAHLAGALGKPTWTLLRFEGGSGWCAGAERSDWYPAMRVFRQRGQAQWGEVIARVVQALREFKPEGRRA